MPVSPASASAARTATWCSPAPRRAEPAPTATGGGVLTISADTPESSAPQCFTAGRRHREQRCPAGAAVLVDQPDQGLRQGAAGDRRRETAPRPSLRCAATSRSGTAAGMSTGWLFSGQGTQYPGMATALYESSAVFREAFDEVDAAMAPHLGRRIRDVMDDERDRPHRVRPARDLRAAVCAGTSTAFGSVPNRPGCSGTASASTPRPPSPRSFSLDDACRLVVARGRLMQQLPAGGGMLAVRATADDVAGLPPSISPR